MQRTTQASALLPSQGASTHLNAAAQPPEQGGVPDAQAGGAKSSSKGESLLLEERGPHGSAWIHLNEPRRRNPLSLEMLRSLIGRIQALAEDENVRVIVLAGGPPAFSAGHDISEMLDRPEDFYDDLFGTCCELMAAIQEAPQPVIACVDGIATAAGCQLAAACDLVVASDRSSFATPGVRIGLFCSTPMVPLTRAVGRKRSMEMLLLGEPINAQCAREWGLVNRVVPAEHLRKAVEELARGISSNCAESIAIGKRAFYMQIEMTEAQAYGSTLGVMSANAAAPFAQDGMRAFLERRLPKQSGSEPHPRASQPKQAAETASEGEFS